MDKALAPFTKDTGIKVDVEVVDWGVQLDRIRNAAVSGEGPDVTQAGTTQVPFFAALGGFEDLSSRVEDIGGSGAYADGVWKTTQVVGQDGTWAVPWFTEARVDLLPQGRPAEGRRRPGDGVQDWDAFRNTLQAIKDKVHRGKPSVRHAGQEGVRPRPSRDAVRLGRRRRRADATTTRSRRSTRRRPSQGVDFFATCSRTAWPTRASSSVTASRSRPVQGRQDRRLDRRPVGAPHR